MRSVVHASALAVALGACGGPQLVEHQPEKVSKMLPATLEAARPKEGEPRSVHVRVWADAGARAVPHWKDDITEQIDYASQLLQPLLGIRLVVDGWNDWNRTRDPHDALRELAEVDKGENATWVIGYVVANDVASKALSELGDAQPLGHHVVVREWADKPETDALASSLPDLKDAARGEVIGAHRRHKQTVVLLHMLATTLGAIAETDPAWIQHPTYGPKQATFSERNRELLGLAIEDRLDGGTDQTTATKLLAAIEKNEWGGWIAADHDQVVSALHNVVDTGKAGKTAADVPAVAYEAFNRVQELAKRGDKEAIVELDNLLAAYPGNATMHQLKCEIMLRQPGVTDKTTRSVCHRVSELAPGDPTVHLVVAEALIKANDIKGARIELAQAEAKIDNLPTGAADAWRRLIGIYQGLGSLTWTEDTLAKAKLEQDPAAALVAQQRARYGVPRGTKVVAPEAEGALVAAVRGALDLIYANKHGEAERALAAAEKRWPGAAGLAAARCDLALRLGQIDAARVACQRAIAADPDESWALYLSGVILLRDASGTAAGVDKLKRAIVVDPDLGQAWRTLAKAYARSNDAAKLDQLAKDYQAKFGQALPHQQPR